MQIKHCKWASNGKRRLEQTRLGGLTLVPRAILQGFLKEALQPLLPGSVLVSILAFCEQLMVQTCSEA